MKRLTAILLLLLCVAHQAYAQDSIGNPTFHKFFLEPRIQIGTGHTDPDFLGQFDLSTGIGLQATYINDRWGGYGVLQYIEDWNLQTVGICSGAVYRLTSPNNWVDCQLYGGIAVGPRLGYDFGIRLAPRAKVGRKGFCWWSATAGISHQTDYFFLTLGLSIGTASSVTAATFIIYNIRQKISRDRNSPYYYE